MKKRDFGWLFVFGLFFMSFLGVVLAGFLMASGHIVWGTLVLSGVVTAVVCSAPHL